jgi:phosphonate transport system substrate-binding protein
MDDKLSTRQFSFSCIFFILLFMQGSAFAEKTIFKVGIVPQFHEVRIYKDWSPLLADLSNRLGIQLKLRLFKSIPDFEVAFLKGELDFAYMNPYQMVMAKRAHGYIPLVRDQHRKLTGILVTRTDSPLKSIHDLEGKKISFPSPNAFAASLYLRAYLTEKEKIRFKAVYTQNHSNAMRHVLYGRSDAAGAVVRTLKGQDREARQNLRILYKSPGMISHPFVVHPRVPLNIQDDIKKSLIQMGNNRKQIILLKAISMRIPVSANYERDYSMLEELNLDRYIKNKQVDHNAK